MQVCKQQRISNHPTTSYVAPPIYRNVGVFQGVCQENCNPTQRKQNSSFMPYINTLLFSVEHTAFMAYHPKSDHSSYCHHSSHRDHIFSLYMFLPGPAKKQKQRGNTEFKGFFPQQQHITRWFTIKKHTGRNAFFFLLPVFRSPLFSYKPAMKPTGRQAEFR